MLGESISGDLRVYIEIMLLAVSRLNLQSVSVIVIHHQFHPSHPAKLSCKAYVNFSPIASLSEKQERHVRMSMPPDLAVSLRRGGCEVFHLVPRTATSHSSSLRTRASGLSSTRLSPVAFSTLTALKTLLKWTGDQRGRDAQPRLFCRSFATSENSGCPSVPAMTRAGRARLGVLN